MFGSSSEKRILDIPGQLNLFNEAEQEQDPALAQLEELEASAPEKAPKERKARAIDAERFKGIPVEKSIWIFWRQRKPARAAAQF